MSRAVLDFHRRGCCFTFYTYFLLPGLICCWSTSAGVTGDPGLRRPGFDASGLRHVRFAMEV